MLGQESEAIISSPSRVAPTPLTDDLRQAARKVRLVVSDMDGTLLDESGRIPEDFWRIAQQLHERGIMFCPASGRQYFTLTRMFGSLLDTAPVIADNGTLAAFNGDVVHSLTLEASIVREAIRTVRRKAPERAALIMCTPTGAYTDCRDPFFLSEARRYYAHLEFVDDVELLSDNVLKLAIFDREDAQRNIMPLMEEYQSHQHLAASALLWVDMINKEANKGIALTKLRERMRIHPENIMVFGDFLNDREMLRDTPLSFAVANAHPEILKEASYIAPSNTEHGVLRTLEELLLRHP